MAIDNKAKRALKRYQRVMEKQAGKTLNSVRPTYDDTIDKNDYNGEEFREDGFVNVLNKYGTYKDSSEYYYYEREPIIPDDYITAYYESNGLFAKIIDLPAEEAIKHGFEIEGLQDKSLENFYKECLDMLEWKEKSMTAIKWARLYGGALAVMIIDDGRNLDEPLDWDNIKSIDDIVVYERPCVFPDVSTVYHYENDDPQRTRGSRLGYPETYFVASRYGSFRVHESRCLPFRNGILPERTMNEIYRLWGIPELLRIKRAIKDSEVAHGSAVKMLERSVQAVYSMRNLSEILETEEGEANVLKRLDVIDMARGLLNSITIDAEGENYDFKTFSYSGIAEVIDTTCNYLSALTNIPQTVLFGRDPTGMNATGKSDLENYYNFVERIQERMIRGNLRYLLSVLFTAGKHVGDIDEIPPIKVKFDPLWSLSELEQAQLEQTKAAVQQTKAAVATAYIQAQVLDPSEIRKELAKSDEFDVETILDDYTEEEIEENDPAKKAQEMGGMGDMGDMDLSALMGGNPMPNKEEPEQSAEGMFPQKRKEPEGPEEKELPDENGPSEEERDRDKPEPPERQDEEGAVGVIVCKDGKILCGQRLLGSGSSTLCGPGGHIEPGENPVMAASREMQEEFSIIPKDLIYLERGDKEYSGHEPYIFLCTDYEGEVECKSPEIAHPTFMTLDELHKIDFMLFQPFKNSLNLLQQVLNEDTEQNLNTPSFNKGE